MPGFVRNVPGFFCAKDLATQVYFWDAYKRACKLARTRRGKFVSPDVAEFLVGGWAIH